MSELTALIGNSICRFTTILSIHLHRGAVVRPVNIAYSCQALLVDDYCATSSE